MDHKSTDSEIFGNNIRMLRKVHRLSQKRMAEIMEIPLSCLQKAEQGIMTDTLLADSIIRAARHFHLRPAQLFAPREQWTADLLLHGE